VQYVVGSVPYVNAKPLVSRFEHLGDNSPVRVLYQVPSSLPALLDSGSAQAVLVSSFDALRTPGRKIAAGCSISTPAEAQSVRLFSKVPIKDIKTLALDSSSLTSIHLCQVALIENYGVRPQVVSMAPDLPSMIAECDACLIIGDKGMLADGEGLTVLDIGAEWGKITDLPFVWATWVGRDDLSPDLVTHLIRAREWGQKFLNEVISETQAECHWPEGWCDHYLRVIMNYELSDRHIQGLKLFQQLLLKNGFITEAKFPEIVEPVAAAL
jgi:predicted solute-binding protein